MTSSKFEKTLSRNELYVAIPMEECQVRWTTYKNLSIWFDEWESKLCWLGFGYHNEHGLFIIPDEQLKHIVNFNETALSLDGSEGRCGSRPAVGFYDPNLPAYKRTSKSSMTLTMITAFSAAGESLAPHFQFPTKAKNKDNMKIECEILEKTKLENGQFGCRREWTRRNKWWWIWGLLFDKSEKTISWCLQTLMALE